MVQDIFRWVVTVIVYRSLLEGLYTLSRSLAEALYTLNPPPVVYFNELTWVGRLRVLDLRLQGVGLRVLAFRSRFSGLRSGL